MEFKLVFPTDDSIPKVVYMSIVEISKKWTMPVRDWGLAYSQFAIFFEERFAAWQLLRVPPSNSRGLSAWKIPVKNQRYFVPLISPYILQHASGRSSALPSLAALLVLVCFYGLIPFTQFIFRNRASNKAVCYGQEKLALFGHRQRCRFQRKMLQHHRICQTEWS